MTTSISIELPFTSEEYATRVAQVRGLMRERGIDVLLVSTPENQFYLTGLKTGTVHVFMILVLPAVGEATWVLRKTELSNVKVYAEHSWVKAGIGVPDEGDPTDILAAHLIDGGFSTTRIGVDRQSWFFHTAHQRSLEDKLASASFVDASGLVEHVRAVKSPAELAYLRAAGSITARSLRRGIEALVDGVTDSRIGAILTSTAFENGSELMSMGPFVTFGPRTFMAHSSFSNLPIRAGDVVNTEMAAVVNRYNTPCFRVSVIGPPSREIERLHRASEAGLAAALMDIRPGITSHEADSIVRRAIERTGFGEQFVVRAAYGIGLGFGPTWGEENVMSLRPRDERVLRPGMCFHVVPALYEEDLGAVCCSMPVVVGERGLEPLLDLEPKLFVR